ncbi:hypothetical protein [Shimazuella kribbensis]|uniref:hypothetical protein n=1 Tax=Shimazuella kribbensis TaxID=139808 RepID=UPI00041DFB68|nr:hypothetical protein [Shimazuella kribbensis]
MNHYYLRSRPFITFDPAPHVPHEPHEPHEPLEPRKPHEQPFGPFQEQTRNPSRAPLAPRLRLPFYPYMYPPYYETF